MGLRLGASAKTGRAEVHLTMAQNCKITKITFVVFFSYNISDYFSPTHHWLQVGYQMEKRASTPKTIRDSKDFVVNSLSIKQQSKDLKHLISGKELEELQIISQFLSD